MKIGYQRVSTLGQNPERQLQGITVDKTYIDYASGKDLDRPEWSKCRDQLRAGDELIVHSLDRLARSLSDLRSVVTELVNSGIKVTFIKENLSFTNEKDPMAILLLSLLGSVAEFERSMIRSRQEEGIALAKAKGIYKGSKKKLGEKVVEELRLKKARGELNISQEAKVLGVTRQTIYSALNAH